jgi:DNA-binding transcriptional LysR family regulator
LVQGGSDEQGVPTGLIRHLLLHDPYLVAVPADWPTPQSLADLAEAVWIGGMPGSVTARAMDRLRRSSGLRLPESHAVLQTPAVLALVGAGLGAALIPRLAVPEHDDGTARFLQLPGLGDRSVAALYPSGRAMRPEVRSVLHALADAADDYDRRWS